MKSNKHLKLSDRLKIQVGLETGRSIKEICRKIRFSKQTIYREIQRNSIIKSRRNTICCALLDTCPSITGKRCLHRCERYIPKECDKVARFPFVCNTCFNKQTCRLMHRYYYAEQAQEKAKATLRDSRKGIKISQEEFYQIDEIISPLIIDKGQSLHHILASHTEIIVSERTIRNWINNGYTRAKVIDLPRTVAFKPKKEYIHRITKPSNVILGRTYYDYKEYCKNHPNLLISQFDTVEGIKLDNKRILTIHFPHLHFQFGILLNSNHPNEVKQKLLELQSKMGVEMWKKIFPIMLSDNGIEFNTFYQLEVSPIDNSQVSKVFYCSPYCSGQKGACERNHEFLRYIEPKYHSFQHLDQDKVDLIFSHINSVYRKSIPGISPYDLALTILGKEFLDIINVKKIEPQDVNLTQSLTKKIRQK